MTRDQITKAIDDAASAHVAKLFETFHAGTIDKAAGAIDNLKRGIRLLCLTHAQMTRAASQVMDEEGQ